MKAVANVSQRKALRAPLPQRPVLSCGGLTYHLSSPLDQHHPVWNVLTYWEHIKKKNWAMISTIMST